MCFSSVGPSWVLVVSGPCREEDRCGSLAGIAVLWLMTFLLVPLVLVQVKTPRQVEECFLLWPPSRHPLRREVGGHSAAFFPRDSPQGFRPHGSGPVVVIWWRP